MKRSPAVSGSGLPVVFITAIVAVVALIGLFIPFSGPGNGTISGKAVHLGSSQLRCDDPDGPDLHRKATTVFGDHKFHDMCGSGPAYVIESICDANGRTARAQILCPQNEVCREGACIPETLNRPGRAARDACYDPDADNLYVRTETTTDTRRVLDQCMTSKIIQEGVCGIDGRPSYAVAFCPGGFVCQDGACKELYGRK